MLLRKLARQVKAGCAAQIRWLIRGSCRAILESCMQCFARVTRISYHILKKPETTDGILQYMTDN